MIKVKEERDINNALIISNEISSLYIKYIVKSVLLRVLGNPSLDGFCTTLSKIESEIDESRLRTLEAGQSVDEEQLYQPLIMFLEPIQKKIQVNLTDLRFLRNDRNNLCHIRHKTVDEQYLLIEKAKNFRFTERFEFIKASKRYDI